MALTDMALTDVDRRLLARTGIAASADERLRFERDGFAGYVSWQLSRPHADDAATAAAIAAATLPIAYAATPDYPAADEQRPLHALKQSIDQRWYLSDWDKKINWEERIRPARETLVATLLRATTQEAQLREIVTDFWRDHFSVSIDSDIGIAIGLPDYEAAVLRPHALGNFRELLEAVATSTSMLVYLDNGSSRASPANENYARELFELHTLGAPAYLNDKYDRWADVPGAKDGAPDGYIDQDVYEAARAFTGWTLADGQETTEADRLEKTGRFTYAAAWHDPYQKRILATEFNAYSAPMADGRRALDLAAFHPATVNHIATKLCRRFVADHPSADLVARAAETFRKQQNAPDQIAQTLRTILLSPELSEAPARLQRPLFLAATMQRLAGVTIKQHNDVIWSMETMGHQLYRWPSPAGHPIAGGYWQAPGFLIRRWRGLVDWSSKLLGEMPDAGWETSRDLASDWSKRLIGRSSVAHEAIAAGIIDKELGADAKGLTAAGDQRWPLAQAVAYLAATPDFQMV